MILHPDRYRRQIAEAWSEMQGFERIQRATERRIEDLRELIRANANFLPDPERRHELLLLDVLKHPTNITEAVRLALFVAKGKDERLTATDIKQRAEERGFNFGTYTNPLASIHTILRRMKESTPPEVEYNEADGTYKLIIPIPGLSPEFLRKTRERVWQGIVNRAVDPYLIHTLVGELTSEIGSDAFEKTTKRKALEE